MGTKNENKITSNLNLNKKEKKKMKENTPASEKIEEFKTQNSCIPTPPPSQKKSPPPEVVTEENNSENDSESPPRFIPMENGTKIVSKRIPVPKIKKSTVKNRKKNKEKLIIPPTPAPLLIDPLVTETVNEKKGRKESKKDKQQRTSLISPPSSFLEQNIDEKKSLESNETGEQKMTKRILKYQFKIHVNQKLKKKLKKKKRCRN